MAQILPSPGNAPYPPGAAVLDGASPEVALQPTENSGCIFSLPAVLHEFVLQAALDDPEVFKKLLLVCRAWASSVPALRSHLSIREEACISGEDLAKEMSQITVPLLKLLNGSVRGPLPATYTPAAAAAAGAEAGGRHHEAPWTATLESLDTCDVDVECTDIPRDFSQLKELTCTFDADANSLPAWLDGGFPPQLQRLRLHNRFSLGFWMSLGQPITEYHGFPRTLRSLHLTNIGEKFFTCLGELTCLKSLTIIDSFILELPVTIRNLTQLQDLTIKSCFFINSLPNEVSDLVSLATLRILGGNMFSFPNLGPHLQASLRVLQLTDSEDRDEPLESFPPDLASCLQLRKLHLHSNYIDTFPDLQELLALQELRVELPQVEELPDVFSSMLSLKKLFISCDYLVRLPLSLATSTSLEVLHLTCKEFPASPAPLICPPNLKDLRIVGAVASQPGTGTGEAGSAHDHLRVQLAPSLKKAYLTSCFQSWTEAVGCSPLTSLEELALFCEGGCPASSRRQETPAQGTMTLLPSLTKLSLWCQEGTCCRGGLETLAGLASLRVLQLGPREWHDKIPEDATSSSLEEAHSVQILRLHHEAPSFLWPAPCLSSIRHLFISGPSPGPLPSALANLISIRNLVLDNLDIRDVPDCLTCLRDLASFQVSGCSHLRSLKLSPTWTRIESLHISSCPKLQSPGESLAKLVTLKTLVLGCTLMHPAPPAVSALSHLTSFSVIGTFVPPRCPHFPERQRTALPSALWQLPSLRMIKATACCICEVPVELPPLPLLESLDLGSTGRFLCLPSLRSLMGVGIRQRRKVRAAVEELRGRTELVTGWLPSSMDCLTQLRKLTLEWNRSQVLPFSFAELAELTHLTVAHCLHLEVLPLELASLPRLANLKLLGCNRLKEIPGASTGFGALERIIIRGCPLLAAQPPTFVGRPQEVEMIISETIAPFEEEVYVT